MKKLLVAVLLLPVLLLVGCASQEAYQGYRSTQEAANAAYYEAAKTPLLSLELPSPTAGVPYKIVVAREVKPVSVAQIKDSEWAVPVGKLISTAGIVGGAWVAADGAANLVEAARSGANGGYQINAGGDVSLSNVGNTRTNSVVGDDNSFSTTESYSTTSTVDNSSTDDHSTVDDHGVTQ